MPASDNGGDRRGPEASSSSRAGSEPAGADPAAPDPEAPDPDEDWIIDRLTVDPSRIPAAGAAGLRVGIGDDAALFEDGRIITVDSMIEGVHWDDKLAPGDVGWKLVAVNVSDIAAMGGRPSYALLALGLPSPLDRAWVEAFADGLHAACARWGVRLIGGDTTRAPIRTASLTVGGHAERPVLRSTGQVGDDVWVTGRLGLAAEGFLALAPRPEARARLRRPEPPVAFAAALAESGLVTAMMDLSDGLARDLGRLCVASGCGASIDPSALPGDGALAWRVGFGEDYELLFCAAAASRDAVRSVASMQEISISRVGRLEARPGLRLVGGGEWPPSLFAHFPTAAPAVAPTGARHAGAGLRAPRAPRTGGAL
ncbi:MAG: thiamine-phosphate kinase [Pseudomonadota bacterium]|nr:thiamine-phosphate kinase [Pseudomonadota bacterium]